MAFSQGRAYSGTYVAASLVCPFFTYRASTGALQNLQEHDIPEVVDSFSAECYNPVNLGTFRPRYYKVCPGVGAAQANR